MVVNCAQPCVAFTSSRAQPCVAEESSRAQPYTHGYNHVSVLNPLDALIPEIPFSFFAEVWVRVTFGARRSISVGFWGPIN